MQHPSDRSMQLLFVTQDSKRGLQNSKEQKECIEGAISALQEIGKDQVTLQGPIDATWKLLWTTEKAKLTTESVCQG